MTTKKIHPEIEDMLQNISGSTKMRSKLTSSVAPQGKEREGVIVAGIQSVSQDVKLLAEAVLKLSEHIDNEFASA